MTGEMRDIVLRAAVPEDEEQLTGLWCGVFGDPPELVKAFFSLLPGMGVGCAAVRDGTVLGAAYLIDGFLLMQPGKAPLRCGYLYAVAVEPAVRGRGLGAAVSRGAAELGRQRGAELICTLPAEESLYRWYGGILSLRHRNTRRLLSADRLPEAQPIAAEAYLRRREMLLRDRPHIRPNASVMEFEAALCGICGGGLYAAGDAIFCAYRDQGRWVIPELLPLPAAEGFSGLSAESLPYLCADRPLPDGLVWNLTFD